LTDGSPNEDLGYLLDADRWEDRVYETKHDCLNQWLKRKHATDRCGRRTLNAYSRTAARFFHHVYPGTHPSELTVGDIEVWIVELSDRDLAANSKRRYVESLSSFYDWAMKRPRFEDITGNPAAVVLEELQKVNRERPESATWENGRKIINQLSDPRDKAVAVLLAKTGCRVDEAVSVKDEDLYLDEGYIRLEDRKGGVSTRNPVDQETIKILRRAQAFSGPETDWVFDSTKSGHIGKKRIRREVRNAAVDAGVMQEGEQRWHHKFTPHYYRTVWTTLVRNYRGAMPDKFVGYLRGDKGDIKDHYISHQPHNQIREEYLEVIKPLGL